jgi:hypothetical protein
MREAFEMVMRVLRGVFISTTKIRRFQIRVGKEEMVFVGRVVPRCFLHIEHTSVLRYHSTVTKLKFTESIVHTIVSQNLFHMYYHEFTTTLVDTGSTKTFGYCLKTSGTRQKEK